MRFNASNKPVDGQRSNSSCYSTYLYFAVIREIRGVQRDSKLYARACAMRALCVAVILLINLQTFVYIVNIILTNVNIILTLLWV